MLVNYIMRHGFVNFEWTLGSRTKSAFNCHSDVTINIHNQLGNSQIPMQDGGHFLQSPSLMWWWCND